MTAHRSGRRGSFVTTAVMITAVMLLGGLTAPLATADGYQRISGEGSSWAANAIDAMRVNVRQFGITVDYNPSGSTAGRKNFLNGTVDFAASDIPFQFQPEDGSAPENPAAGSYAYIPVTAGGTAFMYNLQINGKRVTNLRLSGENIAKMFTGVLTQWNDPAIAADNPGLVMPARAIVPVVRSDGSGSTAQFTKWMIALHGDIWQTYCEESGRAPACGSTSFYPTIPGMIAQAQDIGVAGYVTSGFAEGAIGYVNYSYALGSEFPVAKVLNAAGFYTEPTPENVAVSLLQARINTNEADPTVYLTQQLEGVYTDTDPRNYQLSSYSYLIVPTKVVGQFNEDKGKTLGAFAYYAMCQAQQQSASLGYSPMPINLVQASFDQIRKIPGVVVQEIDIAQCKNPTFAADGSNLLADNAPLPLACDAKGGASQCPNGTGGMANVPTDVIGGGAVPTATTVAGGGAAPANTVAGGGAAPGNTVAGGGAAPGNTVAGGGAAPANTVAGGGTVATGSTLLGDVSGGGAVVDPALGGTAGCDVDTGANCVAVEAAVAPGSVADSAGIGPVTPTVLDQESGWGTSIGLMVLVILLTLALVLAPALVWGRFSQKEPA